MADDMAKYFSGDELWGDDFSHDELVAWFADEAEASIELGEERLRGDYPWAEQQRRHGFAHLPQRRWRHVVGFGSAFGVELRPLVADRATIVEASQRYDVDPALRFPVDYVMARPSGDLDMASGSADLVICFGALHHVANVSHVINEFGRILEPGGYIAMAEPITSMGDWRRPRPNLTPRERGLPLEWTRRALDVAGFDIRNEALFGFPAIRIAGESLNRSPYNSKTAVALDELICRGLRRRVQYHATSRIQRLSRPKTAMWVGERRGPPKQRAPAQTP